MFFPRDSSDLGKLWPFAHNLFTNANERPCTLLVAAAVSYLALVRVLRTRNCRQLQHDYARYADNPYSMDYTTAHQIVKTTILREFPFMYAFSTQFALIKSYGIASGTKLLVQTRRLTTESKVGKRSEDTGVLLGELLVSGIDSPRGLVALSKMNWIHNQYGSKIGNDELIHTLALFILEPPRWIDAFEWRPLTEMERVALFIYWKEIGNRMGMRDIPDTLAALQRWTADYQAENMRYAETNRMCVTATLNLFVKPLPGFLHPAGKSVMACFLESHVRPTLGLQDPPKLLEAAVGFFFHVRAFCIRHFFLPRFREMNVLGKERADGKIVRDSYMFEPWYVPAGVLDYIRRRVFGARQVPGLEWMSEGYLPEELGPVEFKLRCKDAVLAEAEEMRKYAEKGGAVVVGCPFRHVA